VGDNLVELALQVVNEPARRHVVPLRERDPLSLSKRIEKVLEYRFLAECASSTQSRVPGAQDGL